ncbi:WG repeat-containing protein [Herminiimonas sp. KBW02]|uniref:WG repeat-containing protein n=1 Tax=Herminiimonas sp. KBW02 TaxID=2153363 RepID=UPI00131595B2|nr:WG repeat-containing protein [Herminiimonas sp. KBW02]
MFKHPNKHYRHILLSSLFTLAGNVHALDAQKDALALPVCANDRCAVVNQEGVLLMPFDNHYGNIIAADYRGTVFVGDQDMWHLVSADGKKVIKANISDQLAPLTPNYFRFGADGKVGIIRGDGKRIAGPGFEYVYVNSNNPYMVYGHKGKQGLLNAQGVKITDARFDNITSHNPAATRASLVTASNDDGQLWLIDLKTNKVLPTKAASLDQVQDGHLVARSQNRTQTGLVNEKGQLVIDLKYYSLGTPGGGLVSFQEQNNGPCGYLNYQGKVVITAQFSTCLPFGQKEALVRERLANGNAGKFGPINHEGAWVHPPSYDRADLAGLSALGLPTQVKGLLSIVEMERFTAKFGLYDTDTGKEIMPMQYQSIAAISPDWFSFSSKDSPQVKVRFMGSETMMPALGIMDRKGKQLVAPSGFIHISLDTSGRFFQALTGIDKYSKTGLYDLNGNLIVPPNWEMLDIDQGHGVIKAYNRIDDGSESGLLVLHALYSLHGKPLLTVNTLACGAQQALNSAGAVIWPEDPEPYCRQKP